MTGTEKMTMFHNRLSKVFRHLRKQAKNMGVSCYRIYDHDLPEFPFCIELYEDKLYVAEYERNHGMDEAAHESWMEESLRLMSEVLEIPADRIFLKLRKRKAGRLDQYQKFGDVKHEFVIHENGLKFIVNLSDYLDTGLFLDHRDTREMVRKESSDKRVLNLFAYTGSFSVYAAAGGARSVTTVDLSHTYLNWAARNMEINGYSLSDRYGNIHADVKQFLPTLGKESFDIIIMDPPTFSNSKRMKDILDVQRDHVEMINHCMHALSPGGVLYFSTNYRKFILEKEKLQASTIKDITKATTPFDFSGKFSRLCYRLVK